MNKIRFGILSTAKIAREKMIPAMLKSESCEVYAIGSGNIDLANELSRTFNIPKVHASYQSLLDDPNVHALYIPLPNNLHAEWTKKALMAGKHVLCEKPITASVEEAENLLALASSKPHLKLNEAFMYKHHPQWQFIRSAIADGEIGTPKAIQSFFSYNNTDMNNIRNRKETAGGGLMDIGCYCVSWSRWLFKSEPIRVEAVMKQHHESGTDFLTSGILEFENGISSFICATALMPYQRVNILGSKGRIEVEIPVNVPPDKVSQIWVHTASGTKNHVFEITDQYTRQVDSFCQMIFDDTSCLDNLCDSINNMKTIERIVSGATVNHG